MIDYIKLQQACNRGIEWFREMGEFVSCTPYSGYTFIDNNADILAVAHLDTVQTSRKFSVDHKKIYSPRLDDRLGVYIILDMLPLFGMKYDILLTEDEEWGDSTAQYFNSKKEYNWMFQFDRGGTDAVMYQYGTHEYEELLEKAGYTFGWGTYSDICELGGLGCAGFNFGTAYYDNHTTRAFARISELEMSLTKFIYFYTANRHNYLEHDERLSHMLYGMWGDPYMVSDDICPFCRRPTMPHDKESLAMFGMCKDCEDWSYDYYERKGRLTKAAK